MLYLILFHIYISFTDHLQNHEWIKRAERENVDIAGWVCKTMDITPSTPTKPSAEGNS